MEEKKMKNVIYLDHPLLQHKITILRDKKTGTNEFRRLVKEVAVLEGYEALRHLKTELVDVETPIENAKEPKISGKKLCFVPILRAGLGMVDGLLELVPSARVGHIGMSRDEVTHRPHEYYCKLPGDIAERVCLVVDPMLATGGSANLAIEALKKRGVTDIKLAVLVAAPEGVKAVQDEHPDVDIYAAALDDKLLPNGYIFPGLGDAGDRIFGTK